jgi:hypothetical protein
MAISTNMAAATWLAGGCAKYRAATMQATARTNRRRTVSKIT